MASLTFCPLSCPSCTQRPSRCVSNGPSCMRNFHGRSAQWAVLRSGPSEATQRSGIVQACYSRGTPIAE
jgi:hypothetical protein